MRNRRRAAVLAVALVSGLALLAAPAAAASGSSKTSSKTSGKVTRLAATLSGANEVPGPGDPDGRGRAFVRLSGTTACYVLQRSNIGAPTAAHIHQGGAGVAGPVVVLFFQPGTNAASLPGTLSSVAGCVDDQDPALLRNIRRHPADYYANIHTLEFVPGAIRGQLHRLA
jgi:hypothetical protein